MSSSHSPETTQSKQALATTSFAPAKATILFAAKTDTIVSTAKPVPTDSRVVRGMTSSAAAMIQMNSSARTATTTLPEARVLIF
jgi:hypothetical protein